MPPKTPTQSTFPLDNPVTPKAETTRGHVGVGTGNNNNNNNGAFTVPQLPAHVRQAVQETPANAGTAMSSQYNDGKQGRGLGPYIIEDIQKSKRTFVHFLDFLKYLVKCCSADSTIDAAVLLDKVVFHTTEVYNSDEFMDGRNALSAYSSSRSKEEAGYKPFIACVNKAFELLAKKDMPELQGLSDYADLVVHKNDPKEITHKYPQTNKRSALKPDVCLVSKRLLETLERDNKGEVTLKWSYTPGVLELKLLGKKGFSQVVNEYDFKPGTEHVNEYFVLPDIEMKKGDLCASKRLLMADKLIQPEKAFSTLKVEQNNANSSSTSVSVSNVSSSSAVNTASTAASARSSSKRKAEGEPEGDDRHNARPNPSLPQNVRPNEQISMYGMEMLCRGIYSLHTTNFLIVDDIIYIWRYDRQNVIQSTGLNFITDMPYFMALLAALQRFKLEDWGIEPTLAPCGMFIDRNASENPVDITFSNGVIARIIHPASNDLRFRGPVMKGRATCILDATRIYDESETGNEKAKDSSSAEEEKAGVVIKASWPEKTRHNEVHIIEKAVEALAQSEDTKVMLKHLPKVIGWKEFTVSDTGKISENLPVTPPVHPGKPRILRLILFRRLEPLDIIDNEDIFLKVWLDCFKCHYALWNNGIRHGDISVWNLMRDTVTGCGVLNDFDLAVVKTGDPKTERRGGERTGTLPFMARATLEPQFAAGHIPRKYVHELECFVWVLAWLCVKHLEFGKLTNWEWRVGNDSDVALAKARFMDACGTWVKTRYTKAGRKCMQLMELLITIDHLNRVWAVRELPGEAFPHELHLRVIELIKEDPEDIEDDEDFRDRLVNRIKAEHPKAKKVLNNSKKLVK